MSGGLVKWREWGEDVFEEAMRGDKLLLLDISAVWCHWCHVMDDTSYSDPEVAGIINENFIPVRVDTDRMPDVNDRYNMGGWPTTAVLVPTGEVLIGATYIPPPKLIETLTGVEKFYRENRDQLEEKIAELRAKKEEALQDALASGGDEVTGEAVSSVLDVLGEHYDTTYGGFGTEPKFPFPEAVDLLLAGYVDRGDPAYINMAEKTLRGMAAHGMYDQEMGGFFRYSVTRDWSVPHFEKMLDGNSGLIVNYVNAYRITGKKEYLDTVQKTLGYIDGWLWAPEGYFRGSQDADEEYYKLPLAQREKLKAPYVDDTMYTNLNARMADAYMTAWEVLGGKAYLDKALSALGFILAKMKTKDGGLHHFYDTEPRRAGLLTDLTSTVRALLHAYQLTGEGRWLTEATGFTSHMETVYWDEMYGGYYDLPEDPDAVAALAHRMKPMPENAEMSRNLGTLYVLTGERRYHGMAGRCLLPHANAYHEFGHMAAGYALAADLHVKPVLEITIVGGKDGEAEGLLRAACGVYLPRRVIRFMDREKEGEEIVRRGYSTERAAAYICRESVCTARIEDPEALRLELVKRTG